MEFRWRVLTLCALLGILLHPGFGRAASSSVVISQVYSSQVAGSRLRNDFIELLNVGATDVNVAGWTVQVSALTSGTWDTVNLSGTIAPGQYYLIAGATANIDSGIYPLPTANATTNIPLNTTGGQIAIVNTTTLLDGDCPTDNSIVDYVSYGSANSCLTGAAPKLEGSLAAIRAGGGCIDTDSNASDFFTGSPIPHNNASIRNICGTPPSSSMYAVNVPGGGGVSRTSTGANSFMTVGSARYTPSGSDTAPAGFAVFSLKQGSINISEASVPAGPLVRSALVYTELNGAVRTAVAIANPNGVNVDITFTFRDANRVTSTLSGSFTIPAQGQISAFVNDLPWGLNVNSIGVLELQSTAPVGIIAIRGYINERSEFLTTTLPVLDLSVTPSTDAASLAHFAVEGGWRTQIVLVNTSGDVEKGTIQFLDESGQPIVVPFVGFSDSSVPYTIASHNAFTFTINGPGPNLKKGSVRITPSDGGTPEALAVFGYRQNNVIVSEAGLTSVKGARFRTYVESSGAVPFAVGWVGSGIAIANMSTSQTISVDLELANLDGTSSGIAKKTLTLKGSEKIATFLFQQFPTLPASFQGLLRVTSTGPVTLVGLRMRVNTRGDLLSATVPPVDETTPLSSAPLVFPHIADSAGYTTQFILYGPNGLATSGTLQTFNIGGQPLALQIQ